jgi:hypothetical protein
VEVHQGRTVICSASPALRDLSEEGFKDVLPAPYAKFSEIEWIEVQSTEANLVRQNAASNKSFQWQESETGLRVVAYSW